ncbi:MAG: HAD family hydrolase [Chloroflexota bacterium]
MSRKPDAILFDLYNTIVRRVTFEPETGIRSLLKLAKQPSSISIDDALVRNATLVTQLNPVWETSAIWSMEQQFHRLLFDGLGISFDATPDELERCFFEAAVAIEPTEGIQQCLSKLRARGIRLGVVSNDVFTGTLLHSALGRLEIADPFEFVVSSADYGIGKPHPIIFETAVAKLGVERATTWFVGDNLKADIAGANEVGLFSVWYNPDDKKRGYIEPGVTIRSWAEFEVLIETSSGGSPILKVKKKFV